MSNPHCFTVEQHRDELIGRLGDSLKQLAEQSATIQTLQELYRRAEVVRDAFVSKFKILERELATARETVERMKEALDCQIKYCSNGSRHITAVKALAAIAAINATTLPATQNEDEK